MISTFEGGKMESEKILDGRLALIAIQRWKSDKTVRSQFENVSEYYKFLKMKVSSALTIQDVSK